MRSELLRVLDRDPCDPGEQLPVHARAKLDRGAVRPHLHGRAGLDAQLARVGQRGQHVLVDAAVADPGIEYPQRRRRR